MVLQVHRDQRVHKTKLRLSVLPFNRMLYLSHTVFTLVCRPTEQGGQHTSAQRQRVPPHHRLADGQHGQGVGGKCGTWPTSWGMNTMPVQRQCAPPSHRLAHGQHRQGVGREIKNWEGKCVGGYEHARIMIFRAATPLIRSPSLLSPSFRPPFPGPRTAGGPPPLHQHFPVSF